MNKEEFIELLKEYKKNQAKKDLRILERRRLLKAIEKVANDYNTSITSTFQEGGKGSEIISKVENKIFQKDMTRKEMEERIKEIDREIEELNETLDMVNIRLGSLNRLEKEIITAYYIDEMDYKTIGIEIYWRVINQTRSEETVKKKCKKIIDKLINL